MRITLPALAILLAIGCSADRTANDTDRTATPATSSVAPAPTPTTPPPIDMPPPSETSDTVPSRFQGRYATDTTACGDPAHESRLTIESSRIAFHESSGPISRVSQGPAEVTIAAELTGEGETRVTKYSFRLSEDGNTLTDVGNGGARIRCD